MPIAKYVQNDMFGPYVPPTPSTSGGDFHIIMRRRRNWGWIIVLSALERVFNYVNYHT